MEVLVSLRQLERLDKDEFADEEKEEAEEIFKARLEERLEQDQVHSLFNANYYKWDDDRISLKKSTQ